MEQLPSNMVTSEDDAEFEEDDEVMGENAHAFAANNQLLNGVNGHENGRFMDGEDNYTNGDGNFIDNDVFDEDAEGEDDDEFEQLHTITRSYKAVEEDENSQNDEDEEEGEGVGAVKVQPGLGEDDEDVASPQDDDESDESDDNASKHYTELESDVESEVDAEWEAAADEDGDMEPANPNRCVFCWQDEDHDPSPDFEEVLACDVCGDNAHRQCARDAGALKSEEDVENWRCPSCLSNSLEPEPLEPEEAMVDAGASLATRRSSAPKLARDLLPSQRGAINPDSHSVFNHLIVDEDPMDGSRLLRGRASRKRSLTQMDEKVSSSAGKRQKISSSSDQVIYEESNVNEDSAEVPNTDGIEVADRKPDPTPVRASRLREKKTPKPPAAVAGSSQQPILVFRVDPAKLEKILLRSPKPQSNPKPKRAHSVALTHNSSTIVVPSYTPSNYSQPFYSFVDHKEGDESRSKPYGGILTEEEADTSKGLPEPTDRRRFDEARQKAEENWRANTAAAQAATEKVKKSQKVSGPVSQIKCISFGGYQIGTWYAAPYPEEYSRNRVLHICEFCLKYMNSEYVAWRHKMKCPAKHPPGDEIYHDGTVGVFEVDGRKNSVYCQNLCLLAKLFLGSKTLYYDVEPFLFYVMTEYDELGCHFVGYFSKEKRPSSQNNVSCIMTLPIHQRKGYGNLLIDFSYLLTRREQKSGSPEKPLSDMGLVSYRNYWRLVLCYQLRDQKSKLSIVDISERTGMTADDIVSGLENMNALVRDPVTGTYAMRLDYGFMEEYIKKSEDKKQVKLNPNGLTWVPYFMGRNDQAILDHGPPMTAIAPRDTEVDNMAEDGRSAGSQGAADVLGGEQLSGTSSAVGVDNPIASPSNAVVTVGPSSLVGSPKTSAIPPTRFEIYHGPVSNRGTRPRPSLSHRKSSMVGSNPRTSQSQSRSAGTRTPKNSSRRKSGGTGRGPGRWPKGTKKSDFGNAGSGPGLPPRSSRKSKLATGFLAGEEGEEDSQPVFEADMDEDVAMDDVVEMDESGI